EPCEIIYRMEPIYSGESISTALHISGKNYQFDITLCDSETNPQPIDIIPHVFSFNRPWNYICSSITLDASTGESASATILGSLKLPLDPTYTGESADLTNLGLDISFTNMKGYTGEEADVDFFTRPFVTFDIQNLSGEYGETDIYRSIFIGTDITYTGEEVDADMETIGPINPITDSYTGEEVDADFAITAILNPLMYSGQEVDADLKDDPLIELENPTIDTGEEVDTDLEIFQAPALTLDSMYGGELGSSYLNVTYALSSITYTGEYAEFSVLNLDTVFAVDYNTGEEADADIKTNSPDDLEPNADSGEYSDAFVATSLVLFPRTYTGEYSNGAMSTIPAIYFAPKSYAGERAEIDELIEETEYYIAIGGEYSDAGLSREISFTPYSNWTGEEVKTEALNLEFTIFEANSLINGQSMSVVFTTIAGPSLAFDSMWTGEYAESETGILYYPIFILDTIIGSQVMYDGLGGAGGLNFCTDCCPIPNQFGENDDPLIFDVRPQDREVWGRCGPDEDTQFHTSLTAGIRFEPIAYHGEYVKSYIDKQYMAFGEMDGSCDDVLEFCEPLVCIDGKDREGEDCVHDDLYWLYNRTPIPTKLPRVNELEPVITTGERIVLWWEPVDDFVSRMEQKFTVDLTLPSLVDTFYTGEDFIISLSYDESDWKYPFKLNRGGEQGYFTFEANENMRFCPGYLIPRGDNVIFDFASAIFTECFGYFAKTGEMVKPVDLLSEAGMSARSTKNGQVMKFLLRVTGPWELNSTNGQKFRFELSTTVLIKPNRIKSGQSALAHLYRPPTYWTMASGEMARLAQLDVSLPGISWITEDGCIENIFNPLTEDGDIDLEYENFERCVEFMPYFGKVEAICDDSVYIYHVIIRPEMMGNNFVVDKISFATEKLFNLECNSGEDVYIQEYVGEDGAEINVDLETFPVIPLDDFKLMGTGENSFSILNTTNTFEFELYSSEEADAIVNGELVLEFG
ncbi:MAG: hypothetical protein DRN27_08300, partial [Thermoplasmata archaeon]